MIGFDTVDIDGSIDELLEGLKTAFITSLVGMGCSIAFKILSATPLLLPRERVATGKDVGPALVDAMRSQGNQLEALRQAIAGDEESSLAGQIKLFRSDTRDRYDAEKNYMEHSLNIGIEYGYLCFETQGHGRFSRPDGIRYSFSLTISLISECLARATSSRVSGDRRPSISGGNVSKVAYPLNWLM